MRSFRHSLSFLSAGAALFAAVPAWAVDELERKAAEDGMPQMDTSFFPSQIFWLAVTFAILYFLVKRFAIPGVERTQQKRHEIIAAELAAASKANEEAKKTIAAYEKTLVEARATAQATLVDITRQAADKSLARQTEQQQVLHKRLQEAEARIAAARDAAMRDAETAVFDIANAAIEKIIGMKLQVK